MSADNWTRCPKCCAEWSKRQDEAIQELSASYGKVSQEEYATLKEKTINPKRPDETLREDYEVGVGVSLRNSLVTLFSVSYGCSCQECGFSFSFNHEQQIFPKPE